MRRPGHECVLAVSHGGAMTQVARAFGDDMLNHTNGKRVGNCCIAVYEFDDDSALTLEAVHNPNE